MAISTQQYAFDGGELSPLLLGRQDAPIYDRGMFVCLNGMPFTQGAWTRRPGTAFLHQAKFNDKLSRVLPFQFSTEQTYILEFGDLYIRFYTDHGILINTSQSITSITKAAVGVVTKVAHGYLDGERLHLSNMLGMTQLNNREVVVTNKTADTFGLFDTDGVAIDTTNYGTFASGTMAKIFEVPTNYTELELENIMVTQSADTLYITHPDHEPRILVRLSELSWSISDVVFTDGPYDLQNTTATTLTPSAATNDPNSAWVERANQKNVSLISITWNGSIFVAVGSQDGIDAYILTSPDGIAWTERANPKPFNLASVIWNGSLFVAVGDFDGTDAYIVTSPDGITWTERANPKNVTLFGVTWNGSIFVAVGDADGTDAYIVTSSDGITWTERTNPKNVILFGVTWNGSLFVAVGDLDGTDAYIVTSPDGITWTERTNPKNVALLNITWNGSIFVSVGDFDGTDAYIVTSSDGVIWTERANPKNFALFNVTWNGSIFVAVGNADGTDAYIVTSSDGITWTERTNPKNISLNSNVWNGSIFVAVGAQDGTDAYIVTNSGITITAGSIEGTVDGINNGLGFLSTDVGRLIRIKEGSIWGFVVITEVLSPTLVRAHIFSTLTNTAPKTIWRLGLYSNTTGFPRCSTFYEDRLYFGGAEVFPQRFDGSNTSQYTNFSPSATDGTVSSSNAVAGTLNSDDVNAILWMVPHDKGLLIGTTRAEWQVRATEFGEAITPTNITFKPATRRGSANIAPVSAGRNVLFVQRAGRKLREMANIVDVEGFKTPDMSQLAEHITSPGITQLAYQEQPQAIMWAIRSDGVLLGMTYDRDAGIVAWHRHELGGSSDASGLSIPVVESMAIVVDPAETRDEEYFVVQRYINGGVKRYIEFLSKTWEVEDTQEDAFYVDCGLTTVNSPTASSVTGLWHLEGETVGVYIDGTQHDDVVITNGTATLSAAGTVITLGYLYPSDGQTMPLEADDEDGFAQGKIKRIARVGFWLLDTLGFQYGPDADSLIPLSFSLESNNNSGTLDNVIWTERANPKNFTLISITWNGSIFVAVGDADGTDAYIVTSPDGITWTERANPKSVDLLAITWNGTIFVAVGDPDGTDTYLITSPDGITWTERTNPKNFGLTDISWNGSIFVAVGVADGTDAYLITSPDGITWTERANPKNISLSGVAWNGSIFVAVGVADGTDAYLITSPDGITWTERANPKNFNLLAITWNGSIFVAVGAADGTDAYIVTSSDGTTWTERANPKNISLFAITWNGSIFVAVGNADGTDAYIVTSSDGITWTERANPKSFNLFAITWNGSIFVAVGNADGTDAYIVTSPGLTQALFTGVVRERFEGDFDKLGQVYWRADGPFPANVLAIMLQFEIAPDS